MNLKISTSKFRRFVLWQLNEVFIVVKFAFFTPSLKCDTADNKKAIIIENVFV